jgi:hypothetical protein
MNRGLNYLSNIQSKINLNYPVIIIKDASKINQRKNTGRNSNGT